MVSWIEFATAAPDLAAETLERFERTGLSLVGSIRLDGFPRISPVEPVFAGGQLYLGMMYRSTKALDLYREPRCVVHSTVSSRHGTDGETKVYGRARPIEDPDERDRYGLALFEKIGWRPAGEFDLFAVDVVQVAAVVFAEDEQLVKVWRPGAQVRTVVKKP
ncbi:MAG: pyridoxamine 5-phosphate oxidase-related FMN-binding protein [Acidimicrobiaceae bacterium]|jgi:hypothetical protein|nr:pyridoxamine 5-phosphate oxidase-related FMN-binding protein [Acidimicrobiaceae bacterium]